MDADDPTPAGEGAPPRARPPVRLTPKPARMGAVSRLGGDVAALACAGPRDAGGHASECAASGPGGRGAHAGGRACRGRAPAATGRARAPAGGVGAAAGRHVGVGGGMDLRRRCRQGDRDVGERRVQPDPAGGDAPADTGGRAKLQRSRGARILEGGASATPAPADVPPPAAADPPEPILPPVPGADAPAPAPGRRSKVARSPAGSARSAPAPSTPDTGRRPSVDHAQRAAGAAARA